MRHQRLKPFFPRFEGPEIRKIRETLRLSEQEFAKRVGARKGAVARAWERGELPPSPKQALRIGGLEIETVRKSLKGSPTQEQFARQIAVAQSVISDWERGTYPPTSDGYLKIASVGLTYEQARAFWAKAFQRAGVEPKAIERFAESHATKLADERGAQEAPGGAVWVQPIPEIETGPALPFPRSMIPNPNRTHYVRIRDRFGPIFRTGEILVIDGSEKDLRNLDEGEIVAACRSPESVSEEEVSQARGRLESLSPSERAPEEGDRDRAMHLDLGPLAGWLRRRRMPDDLGTWFELHWPGELPYIIAFNQIFPGCPDVYWEHWRVLGRVVAWIAASVAQTGAGVQKEKPNE